MQGIYATDSSFPFNKLQLTPPTVLSGGNYFIKYLIDGEPLYIQPPKCKTRGGISKPGKRMHCDLMFSNDNVDFIRWMEELEAITCKTLFQNRETWFETEMEMSDIENYFASPLKIYKSGKFYLARTNIGTRLGKMSLKIYDEDEQDVDPESIGETSQIMTILEVQGIKCSARSFQIEIEIKQMMLMKPVDLFEKCLIQTSTSHRTTPTDSSLPTTLEKESTVVDGPSLDKIEYTLDESLEEESGKETKDDPLLPSQTNIPLISEESISNTNNTNNNTDNNTNDELTEINVEVDAIEDTVQIKERKEVYYEMYREARRKAKASREIALSAYLEAKHIKQIYSLDSGSESDNDNEDTQMDFSTIEGKKTTEE
jgi:hypothetical protein